MAAIWLKNIVKESYGGHSSTYYDKEAGGADQGSQLKEDEKILEDGKNVLMAKLLDLLMHLSGKNLNKIQNAVSEVIALMGRKYVQKDWP